MFLIILVLWTFVRLSTNFMTFLLFIVMITVLLSLPVAIEIAIARRSMICTLHCYTVNVVVIVRFDAARLCRRLLHFVLEIFCSLYTTRDTRPAWNEL